MGKLEESISYIQKAKSVDDLIGKKWIVYDKGWIELQAVYGSDLDIVNSARTSYLGESKGDEKDKKLINYLIKNKHTSPSEVVRFKFRVYAPLVTWWQWTRHRMQSLNLQSGRYVKLDNDMLNIKPNEWRLQAKKNKQMSEGFLIDLDSSVAEQLSSELDSFYNQAYNLYQNALKAGVAREQARMFLPGFAVYYLGVSSMDAHNLMHFLKLRMAQEAQYEIRMYALVMFELFKKALPWTSEAFIKYQLGS